MMGTVIIVVANKLLSVTNLGTGKRDLVPSSAVRNNLHP